MIELTDDPDTPILPPAEERAFDQLLSLIHLIGNAELYENRMAALRKEGRQTARARLELSNEERRHTETTKARVDRAEAAEKAARMAHAKLAAEQEALAGGWERLREEKRLFELQSGRVVQLANGLTQEFSPEVDRLFDQRTEVQRVERTEEVPGGRGLTRTVVEERRVRRGADA